MDAVEATLYAAAPLLLDLDLGLLLRVLLSLPSADAFRAAGGSRSCYALLGGGDDSAALAAARFCCLLVERSAPALHSSDALWLHGLVGPRRVAEYARRAQGFRVIGELQFRAEPELARIESAADHVVRRFGPSSSPGEPGIFVCEWVLPAPDAAAIAEGRPGVTARSRPQRFCWLAEGHQKFSFDVHLVLASLEGGLTLGWEPLFRGDVLQEEADCVEVDLAGSVVLPWGEEGDDAGPAILDVTGGYGPAAGGAWRILGAASQAGRRLRATLGAGPVLLGLLRVAFRSMGDEQPVTPAGQVCHGSSEAKLHVRRRRIGRSAQALGSGSGSLGGSRFDQEEFEQFLSVAHGSFRRLE